jgi:Secretion system C-terminal sorting domain
MKKYSLIFLLLTVSMLAFAQEHTLTIRANPSNSWFRFIKNYPPDIALNDAGTSIVIADWTVSGTGYNWRSLLKISLSAIPAGSVIDTAYLSLHADIASSAGASGSPTFGSDNAVGIYRITGTWDTTTVSWNVQPAYTTVNAVTLPQSSTATQDYLNVDVTNLVKDAYASGNKGFLFKHIQELMSLNSMIFYSPYEYPIDSTKAPMLVIKYKNHTAISNVSGSVGGMTLFPNPASRSLNVSVVKDQNELLTISVLDCAGRLLITKNVYEKSAQANVDIELGGLSKGLYIVRLNSTNGNIATQKLIVE